VTAWGAIRPGAVEGLPEVDCHEPDEVAERELEVITVIDRKVRGSARALDIVAMLAQPGRLLLHADQGYAVAKESMRNPPTKMVCRSQRRRLVAASRRSFVPFATSATMRAGRKPRHMQDPARNSAESLLTPDWVGSPRKEISSAAKVALFHKMTPFELATVIACSE
jgi:hypothetical protein